MSDSVLVKNAVELTRGQRLWLRLLETRETGVSLWRARLLTESWKATEGLPQPIRRAKAFARIVTGIPIYIDEEQLLVGDFGAEHTGLLFVMPVTQVRGLRKPK